MKKLLFTVAALIMLFAAPASADTFNNSAFIGTWLSSGATDDDFGELTLDFIDSSVFNCHFVYKKAARPTNIYYTIYQGVMNDTYGTARFSVSNDDVENYAFGTMELYLHNGQVRVKMLLDKGILMYEGWLNPQMEFEPFTSAYNYNVSIELNGEPLVLDPAPIIIRNRTYVPVRGVFEACGINVFWDDYKNTKGQNQSITFTRDDIISKIGRLGISEGFSPWSMNVWSGADATTENEPLFGVDISDIQPIIINNSSYMPLRAIVETFGVNVNWIDETRTVELSCDTQIATKKTREETDRVEDFSKDAAYEIIKETNPDAKADVNPYFTVERKYYVFDDNGTKIKVFSDNTVE